MEIWGEGLVGSEKWTGEQTHNGHIKTESFFKCVHLACFFPQKNGSGYTIAQQKVFSPITSYT